MNQKKFLSLLQGSKRMQSKLKKAADESDGYFYFELGSIFDDLNIQGWESDAFIEKVCKICGIDF